MSTSISSSFPRWIVVSACLLTAAGPVRGEEPWRPAKGPLSTRWAKEVSPENALPEHPRPTLFRPTWKTLNGLWDYARTAKSAETPPDSWEGKILVPFPIESALSGVMQPLRPDQRLWQRRSFSLPTDWAGKRILLHFGAVDWEATVFLNGKRLGSHRGGYDPFTFDVTDALGEGAPQELVVSAWDPTNEGWQLRGKQTLDAKGGAFYTAVSGIWQTVWLEAVPQAAVESLVAVADTNAGVLRLTVNARTPVGETQVVVLASSGGTPVAKATGALGRELGGRGVKENLAWFKAKRIWVTTDLVVPIPEAKFWSPHSPHLYDLKVELRDAKGEVLDEVESYFGMRSVSVGKDERGTPRPMLSGEAATLAGALDQGYWPDGLYTAPTDAALKFDVEAAKQLGLTAVRKHLKVEPERYYYWADKLGLLVLQDLPSGNDGDPYTDQPTSPEASTTCEMERRLLIQSRRNHPSIIAWVLFNEGWGQHDTLRHAKWAKQLDPTRLVDEASGFPRHGGGDLNDVHGGDAPNDGRRISLDTETGGFGLVVPGHQWPGKPWATGTFDAKTGKEGAAETLAPLDAASKKWFTERMKTFYRDMWSKRESAGSSGDFKVQLYDVETESNGLLSYDREVWKVDVATVAAAARGGARRKATTDAKILAPTAKTEPLPWRYSFRKPQDGWQGPFFDDAEWEEGKGGFGSRGVDGGAGPVSLSSGPRIQTEWRTPDLWLRREFTLDAKPVGPRVRILHDDEAEVYVNGVLACRATRYNLDYEDFDLTPEGVAALKVGKNVFAVHVHQDKGPQYIDVGLVDAGPEGDH